MSVGTMKDLKKKLKNLHVSHVLGKLRVIRKAAALARGRPTLALSCEENAARRYWNCPTRQFLFFSVFRLFIFLFFGVSPLFFRCFALCPLPANL